MNAVLESAYASGIVRPYLLAPKIVEAILDGAPMRPRPSTRSGRTALSPRLSSRLSPLAPTATRTGCHCLQHAPHGLARKPPATNIFVLDRLGRGRRGTYVGILGGVLLLTALQTLLAGTTFPTSVRSIIYGLVIMSAVIALRERR
jgi:hypothetical protein